MARRPVSDEEASAARDVLQRQYREWVQATALDLARAVIDDEVQDYDRMNDRIHETCDSALVYYSDQHLVLFASNSTQDGLDAANDAGGIGGDNGLGIWAYFTFEFDVREALDPFGLDGDFDRDEWMIEAANGEHGEELVELCNKVLLQRVQELTRGDSDLSVEWDKHLEAGGTPAEFLEEHE